MGWDFSRRSAREIKAEIRGYKPASNRMVVVAFWIAMVGLVVTVGLMVYLAFIK
jgi:hypothetical protein